jgi:geranylgeranyl pyrophosphate synthase
MPRRVAAVSRAAVTGIGAWVQARREEIDAALEDALAYGDWPSAVREPMRYSVRAGGKRLRPLLALAAADTVAPLASPPIDPVTARGRALPVACAIELVHTYSLVHDDLPAMDDDVLRRGQPTTHVAFGEGPAILAGDGLLTEAFALIARGSPAAGGGPAVADRTLEAIGALATAAGPAGMVGGQAIDLQLTGEGGSIIAGDALARLRDMHARKTGALIRAAAVCGAIMGGAPGAAIAAIDAFAADLGLAFQIVDDILDVEGTDAQLGKTAGKDAAAGKLTYPALVGLATSKQLAADASARADASLARLGVPAPHLRGIAAWVLERRS